MSWTCKTDDRAHLYVEKHLDKAKASVGIMLFTPPRPVAEQGSREQKKLPPKRSSCDSIEQNVRDMVDFPVPGEPSSHKMFGAELSLAQVSRFDKIDWQVPSMHKSALECNVKLDEGVLSRIENEPIETICW